LAEDAKHYEECKREMDAEDKRDADLAERELNHIRMLHLEEL
jgi:hypothetical protein